MLHAGACRAAPALRRAGTTGSAPAQRPRVLFNLRRKIDRGVVRLSDETVPATLLTTAAS